MSNARDKMLKRWQAQQTPQSNKRGMGLARDVQAGQARPVMSQAERRRRAKQLRHKEWLSGWRHA